MSSIDETISIEDLKTALYKTKLLDETKKEIENLIHKYATEQSLINSTDEPTYGTTDEPTYGTNVGGKSRQSKRKSRQSKKGGKSKKSRKSKK